MAARYCTEKSERGEMVFGESEKRGFQCKWEEGFVVRLWRASGESENVKGFRWEWEWEDKGCGENDYGAKDSLREVEYEMGQGALNTNWGNVRVRVYKIGQ